jgi:hypothetical protein
LDERLKDYIREAMLDKNPSSDVKLFDVGDSFSIIGRGLCLITDFPVITKGIHRKFKEQIAIVRPDMTREEYQALFEVHHFSMENGTGKFAWVVVIPTAPRGSIPRGSQVFGRAALPSILAGQLG